MEKSQESVPEVISGVRENAAEQPGTVGMTRFALRHWDPNVPGTKIEGMTPDELVAIVSKALREGAELVDGYAPFCKHIFIENASETRAGYCEITAENMEQVRTGYVARREGELPVLARWLEGVTAPRAKFLDVILYTRASLEQEADAKPNIERDVPDADWGIVTINGELRPQESPMLPITMMRNALGKAEGGSGHPLDRGAYLASCDFWNAHAVIQ